MSILCNSDTTHLGQWIGFYVDGGDDPGFVLQCINDFAPTRLQLHHLYMPLPVQCFTIGNYSRCLREWENPMEEMLGFFHEVKLIYTTRGPKKDGDREEINFFYGKQAPLVGTRTDGHCFLNHTTKLGRNSSIDTNPGYTRSAVKWQGYISWATTYFFFWSQVWDPLRSGKEAAFTWSIWQKVVTVNEWRARIAPASTSKQYPFCLPNTSESIKHEIWDCIQTKRAWRWATFIMHELCVVRTGNYDSLNWNQSFFGERIPRKFVKNK